MTQFFFYIVQFEFVSDKICSEIFFVYDEIYTALKFFFVQFEIFFFFVFVSVESKFLECNFCVFCFYCIQFFEHYSFRFG